MKPYDEVRLKEILLKTAYERIIKSQYVFQESPSSRSEMRFKKNLYFNHRKSRIRKLLWFSKL